MLAPRAACVGSIRTALDARDREPAADVHRIRFGRPPDFIDGHQHVQLFPQVRDAVLEVAQRACAGCLAPPVRPRRPLLASGSATARACCSTCLSKRFRERAAALGVRTNPAFAGTYAFTPAPISRRCFRASSTGFRTAAWSCAIPGFVDAELRRLDPLTDLREKEYAFFADEAFPKLLADARTWSLA